MQEVKANKRLGQHFLTDTYMIECLSDAVCPKPGEAILEIGPGLGALTLPVLQRCNRMTAIEFDRRMLKPLQEKAALVGELSLIADDVLQTDFVGLAESQGIQGKWRVIGNLPYNLSSPILFHCLAQRDCIADMHFMLQKEVVERIVAEPGSKAYGRLSLMAQLWCEAKALFDIPPGAFTPPPRVESAFVRLVPRSAPTWAVVDIAAFDRIVRTAFSQRRKMLRKSLAAWFNSAELEQLGIEPTARPETLSGNMFADLSNALYRKEISS